MSQKLEINKSKVCLVKSSFGQHFRCTVPDCVTFPILSFLFVIDQNDSFFKPKLITFPENPLSKYLMGMVDFNKQDIDIFINYMSQKYRVDIGRLFKITRQLELLF